ncbi:putative meiotic recombination protein DMC1 [Trypanosoma rangeli]|uniref:Putative meiotic recombination protein DMC1 n=1 Tax=Trypanosoma rangeli TaxID=5698 RepID=A0A3R7M9F0_TRYRA|nr:putative meiotic recombination protein DMC1 [Trypanosoma rangeli]RNF11446.1 putative meiotic recombination protein DMC1 [Trypanosoma rangeli]|eukprot:RNF11446.1 putative meiotic recombination protein DMC1 [Trypanosoma rangeli]
MQHSGTRSNKSDIAKDAAHCSDTSTCQEDAAHVIVEVDRLTEQGVAAADIVKLRQAGIFTVTGIHMQCRKDLALIKGLSDAKVEKIIEAARKLLDCGFTNGATFLQQRGKVTRMTTGSTALDQLLGGGIESMSITEAFGEFRTGKTQIAHTLCVTCQMPTSMGGGNGKAIYVDTEATFRPERIKPIASRFGLDADAVLNNILVARAYTHEHQMHLLSMVAAKMAEDQFGLLVVDSITALFRVDFSGRGELAERQQKLAKMMSHLIKLAEEFNVAVYITNQVVADPGGASMFVADPKKPVGGHILAHASTTRLSLRKGRGDQRICKIYDSPSLPEVECVFSISEQGIVDARE